MELPDWLIGLGEKVLFREDGTRIALDSPEASPEAEATADAWLSAWASGEEMPLTEELRGTIHKRLLGATMLLKSGELYGMPSFQDKAPKAVMRALLIGEAPMLKRLRLGLEREKN